MQDRRSKAWASISPLYVDSETRPALAFSAWHLADTGYSDAELTEIWRHEVHPQGLINAISPLPYEDIDIEEAVFLRWQKLNRLFFWAPLWHTLTSALFVAEWRCLVALTKMMRACPPEQRRSRAHTIFVMAKRYTDEYPEHADVDAFVFEHAVGWAKSFGVTSNREALMACFENDMLPFYRPMLIREEARTEDVRIARVLALIDRLSDVSK